MIPKLNIFLVLFFLAGGCSKYGVGRSDGGDSDGPVDAGGDKVGDQGGDPSGDDGAIPSDTGGDTSGNDGGEEECVIKPRLPVGLQLGEDIWQPGYGEVAGDAWVVYKGYPQSGWESEVWLFFPEDHYVEKVYARLPFDYEIPVSVGDEIWARVVKDAPWWVNQYAEIKLPAGGIVYDQIDCDLWLENPQARCPPVEEHCATSIYPAINLWNAILEQGEWAIVEVDSVVSKVFVGSLYIHLAVNCTDMPNGWIERAVINNRLHSQCRCQDNIDCLSGEVCDTVARRCVENRCVVVDCAPGFLCDPYTGDCVEPPASPCRDAGDCGDMQVCNTLTGVCKEDFCQIVDCAPCSALIGECYQCLHDCDCGLEVCNRQSRSCEPGCVESKVGLTRENPEMYELYYVCVREDFPQPAELMNKFEPLMTCGNTSPPSTCDPLVETACMAELAYDPNSRRISWEKWKSICAISRNPVVNRIAGGHYLP